MSDFENHEFCISMLVEEVLPGESRPAILRKAKWRPGDRIDVSFLDGVPSIQERVEKFAQEWVQPGMANLQLVFRRDTTNTPIRISFKYKGQWSAIGTECFSAHFSDRTQPTMNFGAFDENTLDEKVRRVVLHEFGHALGLIHEHQSPAAGIHWNEEQLFKDFSGPPNNWTREQIYRNVVSIQEETNFYGVRSRSIMIYPIRREWNTDGLEVPWNNDLSQTDKKFIREQYPR